MSKFSFNSSQNDEENAYSQLSQHYRQFFPKLFSHFYKYHKREQRVHLLIWETGKEKQLDVITKAELGHRQFMMLLHSTQVLGQFTGAVLCFEKGVVSQPHRAELSSKSAVAADLIWGTERQSNAIRLVQSRQFWWRKKKKKSSASRMLTWNFWVFLTILGMHVEVRDKEQN